MSEAIAEALLTIGGVGFRPQAPVRFKSGLVSPVYCDNRRFPFHPEEWALVIAGFETLLREGAIAFDVIGGIEAAGIPHSAALGFAMRRPSVFIRKEAKAHGTKKRVEGGDVSGRRVVLVEDLITTGLSSLSGVEALRAEGAVVEDCLVIVSYALPAATEAFAAAGVRVHALTSFPEILAAAERLRVVSGEDAAVVRDWLSEPHGWGARMGLEAGA